MKPASSSNCEFDDITNLLKFDNKEIENDENILVEDDSQPSSELVLLTVKRIIHWKTV